MLRSSPATWFGCFINSAACASLSAGRPEAAHAVRAFNASLDVDDANSGRYFKVSNAPWRDMNLDDYARRAE
jgi:hypothetical protein